MPSRRLAIALAAMLLLSGCSMLPGGGGGNDSGTIPAGPEYHALSFTAETGGTPFEGTVTVEKNGSVVHEQSVSGDGNGTFANLTTFDEPGPYVVTVNTTIPAASGNRSDRFRVDGALGNETVIDLAYLAIESHSVRLPRQEMTEPVYVERTTELPVYTSIVIEHRGETVYAGGVPEGTGALELTTLPETGVYRVGVTGLNGERWTNDTVVVRDPASKLFLQPDGSDGADIEIYPPEMDLPR